MKVFYSWQLDADRKINKDLIHDALQVAIGELNAEIEFWSAERNLELDQDTKGIMGSPPIAQVIFDKITASDVFVADVSLVAKGSDEKLHINSNVAIELGFALGKKGYEPLLKIMNTAFGDVSSLPFDLKDRRHPIQYHLEAGASKTARDTCKANLAKELKSILRAYQSRTVGEQQAAAQTEHHEMQPGKDQGRFWNNGDVLVQRDRDNFPKPLECNNTRLLYFRCVPKRKQPHLTSREALDVTADLSPLCPDGGHSRARNQWGALSFNGVYDRGELLSASQILLNREIWAFDAYLVSKETEIDGEKVPIVPTGAMLREISRSIRPIREKVVELGYGDDYWIEIGIVGAKGLYLASKRDYFPQYPGPIHQAVVHVRLSVSSEHADAEIYNKFVQRLFAEAGGVAPDDALMG